MTVLPNPDEPDGDNNIFTERLKGINEDKQVYPQFEGAWTTSISGSDQQYAGEDGTISYA